MVQHPPKTIDCGWSSHGFHFRAFGRPSEADFALFDGHSFFKSCTPQTEARPCSTSCGHPHALFHPYMIMAPAQNPNTQPLGASLRSASHPLRSLLHSASTGLIMASTVHQQPPSALLNASVRPRVLAASPQLADTPKAVELERGADVPDADATGAAGGGRVECSLGVFWCVILGSFVFLILVFFPFQCQGNSFWYME